MKLGLREANQCFSRAIRAVRAGKEVVLTDRGRPIAVIRPLRDSDDEQAALRAMTGDGVIIAASHEGPMPAPRWRPVVVKGRRASHGIIEDREERV